VSCTSNEILNMDITLCEIRKRGRQEAKEKKPYITYILFTARQTSRAIHATVNLCVPVYKQSWFNNPVQLNNKEIYFQRPRAVPLANLI